MSSSTLDRQLSTPRQRTADEKQVPQQKTSRRLRMMRRIVAAIEVTGLLFLVPPVKLAFGEEPRRQFREILRLIVIPTAAFLLFLLLWTHFAPKHKTKSGEVPTPAVVWRAAKSIWNVHEREGAKERAFLSIGPDRDAQLNAVRERLALLGRYESAARTQLAAAELENAKSIEVAVRAATDKLDKRRAELTSEQDARLEKLNATAAAIPTGDIKGREQYLAELRKHNLLVEQEQSRLSTLDDELARLRERKSPDLIKANHTLAQIAEETQHLRAIEDQLSTGNRSVRVTAEIGTLRTHQRDLLRASGDELADAAARVLQAEQRVAATAQSSYAKPWTLPMQISRSVACVFVGFLLGTAIAIPIGILCGLNDSFMAAMTPFIALFKPVSPIVWLPIALIIVGGFITNPESHWLLTTVNAIPGIGWLRINPAFIASALTVSLCSLWATLVNTALGVASVNSDFINVARVLHLGFWSRLFKIIIPSAMPLMFAGLRISLGVGWMVLVAGELLSSSEGIGKFVWDQFNNGASDSFAKMIVVVFVVGGIGLLLDRIMVIVQRLFSFESGAVAV